MPPPTDPSPAAGHSSDPIPGAPAGSPAKPPASAAQQGGGQGGAAAAAEPGRTTLLGGLAARLGGGLPAPPGSTRGTRRGADPDADKSKK